MRKRLNVLLVALALAAGVIRAADDAQMAAVKAADDDRVAIARQDPRGVRDRFAAADLRRRARQLDAVAAERGLRRGAPE